MRVWPVPSSGYPPRVMLRRLLVFVARRPLAALLLALTGLVTVVALGPLRGTEDAGGNPRLVLNRVWFDRYPDKRTDEVQIWIFLGGGIGIHEKGSAYRATTDVFEFERQGDKLALTFLHDKKSAETKFAITACDDKPPFNLCLDLVDSPRGQKRWYGFGDEEEMARKVPWGRAMMRSAESRAGVK